MLIAFESLKISGQLILLTYFCTALLLTGSGRAATGLVRVSGRMGYFRNEKIESFARLLETIFMPIGAYIMAYSIAGILKYEHAKDFLSDNSAAAAIAGGGIALTVCFIGAAVEKTRSVYGITLFEYLFLGVSAIFWRCVSFLRVTTQVFLFALPYLFLSSISAHNIDLSPGSLMTFGLAVACYAFLLATSLRVINARRRERLLFYDVGYFLALLAIACFAFETNLIHLGSILGIECTTNCLLFDFW